MHVTLLRHQCDVHWQGLLGPQSCCWHTNTADTHRDCTCKCRVHWLASASHKACAHEMTQTGIGCVFQYYDDVAVCLRGIILAALAPAYAARNSRQVPPLAPPCVLPSVSPSIGRGQGCSLPTPLLVLRYLMSRIIVSCALDMLARMQRSGRGHGRSPSMLLPASCHPVSGS